MTSIETETERKNELPNNAPPPKKNAVNPRTMPCHYHQPTSLSQKLLRSTCPSQPIQPLGSTGSLLVDPPQIIDASFLEIELVWRQGFMPVVAVGVLGRFALQLLRSHSLYPARAWSSQLRHAGFELVGSGLHGEIGRLVGSWAVGDDGFC